MELAWNRAQIEEIYVVNGRFSSSLDEYSAEVRALMDNFYFGLNNLKGSYSKTQEPKPKTLKP